MSREKQIDEIAKLICTYPQCTYYNIIGGCEARECIIADNAEKIYNAGYRKQSENVIELPCRVGDTMYVKYKGIAYPVKVNAIRIDTKKNNHRICVSGTFHLYEYYDHDYKATFPFDSIGKSLFYTEAEAMKGGEGYGTIY
jgi:hypothetical protein